MICNNLGNTLGKYGEGKEGYIKKKRSQFVTVNI